MEIIRDQDNNPDPNFGNKVIELTVRLIFGIPGNEYGKGLGFLDYCRKFNEYRDYDIQGWDELQHMGFLMFL